MAVDPHTETVAVYQRLAAADPGEHERRLADALIRLGNLLADLDRPDEAVGPTGEALVLYQRLVATDPEVEPNRADAEDRYRNLQSRTRSEPESTQRPRGAQE